MSTAQLYLSTAVFLLVMGLYGVLVRPHLLRKITALNVMSAGLFLIFVAVAYRGPEAPPDPVPHAMVLTGIVISVSATAFGLLLIRRVLEVTGRAELAVEPEERTAANRQSVTGKRPSPRTEQRDARP
ncbi:MAG: cation:proton antiporter subunit C [Kiritimatiellae bacterium]|nr:cation:proton antiporter subunit C [Kiritimatiellia bacterium]MDW8457784.1 cation:proton antiporter subunit C [Verrucomicrobiota bacterium]